MNKILKLIGLIMLSTLLIYLAAAFIYSTTDVISLGIRKKQFMTILWCFSALMSIVAKWFSD